MTLVTLSSKNQITMPVWALDAFNLRQGGRFLMSKNQGYLVLKPVTGSIVDEIAGSLEHLIPEDKKKIPVDEAIRLGKIAKAKKIAEQ